MSTIITNGRLLDCIGDEPLEDSSVVVEEGIIKDIYTGKKPEPKGATVIDVGGRTVLPGLTDAHVHPALTETPHVERRGDSPPLYIALRQKADMERQLQGGFTTVRDAAWAHWSLKQAVKDGLIKGPRLLIACGPLSSSGGHFFTAVNPRGELLLQTDVERIYKGPRVCDGVDECIKGAREQFRNGADHIKIGFPFMGFSAAEICAIVEEAEARGSYVMANCRENWHTVRAVECGVRTIEHGRLDDEETAKLMKRKGAFFVPTVYGDWRTDQRAKLSPDHEKSRFGAAMRGVEFARRAGVAIGSGSEYSAYMSSPKNPWSGLQGLEFKLKTECGMTPYEAIKSATMVNAKIFRMEDKIGSLEVGKWADIIAVDGNPDEDIELLAKPESVKLVLKEGEVFKNTL